MEFPALRRALRRRRGINTFLEIVIAVLALDLIFAPLYPALIKAVAKAPDLPPETAVVDPLTYFANAPEDANYLVIPSLGIERTIVEAKTIKEVHENVWRRPMGSTPPDGSNTILVAHRYATIGGNRASTFYSLPDIAIDADIYVRWEGSIYVYRVTKTDIVLPTQIEIEGPSETPILTLYTCTPLWKADKRFVVVAALIDKR